MTKEQLERIYFQWICKLVKADDQNLKLLWHLFEREFIFSLPMDANRADDGINLRYRFAYEEGYDDRIVALYLDDKPCSMLEMIAALALRCEEHIMNDDEFGDRTSVWFWKMLSNLGLVSMKKYNKERIDAILDLFMSREYSPDGHGGLFIINEQTKDLRNVEIWNQMHAYLNEII